MSYKISKEVQVNIVTCSDDLKHYDLDTQKINHLILETLSIINIL